MHLLTPSLFIKIIFCVSYTEIVYIYVAKIYLNSFYIISARNKSFRKNYEEKVYREGKSVTLIRSSFSAEFQDANFAGDTKQRRRCVKECWWKSLNNRIPDFSPMLFADVASRSFSFRAKSRSISRGRIGTERFYGLSVSPAMPQRVWLYDVPSLRWQCDVLSSCFSFPLCPASHLLVRFLLRSHSSSYQKALFSRFSRRKLTVSTNRSCNGDKICDSLDVEKNSESIVYISERGKNF